MYKYKSFFFLIYTSTCILKWLWSFKSFEEELDRQENCVKQYET